jgi:pyridoxal phosphate enzyme (YggS family)
VSLIAVNMRRILAEIPDGVDLVVVAKGRSPAEVREVVNEGARIIGENYVQEAVAAQACAGREVAWHFVGHLQSNKVKKAVAMFDMIQTVDSLATAIEISRCAGAGRALPVLIEVNSARERQKSGLLPEQVASVAAAMSALPHIRVMGLMTMGPAFGRAAEIRPYFKATRTVFETLARARLPNVEMKHLSMGMSDSYREAIEEGANMVRLGRVVFGERQPKAAGSPSTGIAN